MLFLKERITILVRTGSTSTQVPIRRKARSDKFLKASVTTYSDEVFNTYLKSLFLMYNKYQRDLQLKRLVKRSVSSDEDQDDEFSPEKLKQLAKTQRMDKMKMRSKARVEKWLSNIEKDENMLKCRVNRCFNFIQALRTRMKA